MYEFNSTTRKNAAPKIKQYDIERLRWQVGRDLFDLLFTGKLPAVVDISEEVIDLNPSDEAGMVEYRIKIDVRVVPHVHVSITDMDWDWMKTAKKRSPWKLFGGGR